MILIPDRLIHYGSPLLRIRKLNYPPGSRALWEDMMKSDIHPTLHPVIFIDGEHEIVTRSTMKSGEKREVNGVEHYVVNIDISAFTHPFFTGKQRLLDTEGRVERFRRKFGSRSSK
jgi:large subunit ribosomal protein L31